MIVKADCQFQVTQTDANNNVIEKQLIDISILFDNCKTTTDEIKYVIEKEQDMICKSLTCSNDNIIILETEKAEKLMSMINYSYISKEQHIAMMCQKTEPKKKKTLTEKINETIDRIFKIDEKDYEDDNED